MKAAGVSVYCLNHYHEAKIAMTIRQYRPGLAITAQSAGEKRI
jgi:hypothetical protein